MKRGYTNYIIAVLSIIILVMAVFLIFKNIEKQKPDSDSSSISREGMPEESSAETKIGGCQTRESCIEYCSMPENNQKCINFFTKKSNAKVFFPFPPGDCKNKEVCDNYCNKNKAECDYYTAYAAKAIENIFDKNESDIIIPVKSPEREIAFYKIGTSHFLDPRINREFENFKENGINAYSFPVEVSYLLGDVAYDINSTEYGIETWPGYFEAWKTGAAYLIGKTHLNGLKFIYTAGPTDWDSWYSPQYSEHMSKEMIDDWVKNYTQPIREVSQFAQSANVDVLIIGATPAIVKIKRNENNEYLNFVYEKLLQEMLKEARKWYKGEIGFDFGNGVSGTIIEFERIPEIGKFEYVVFSTSAKAIDTDDPFQWADKTLKIISEAEVIAKKNSAKGIILGYEFGETDVVNAASCASVQPYNAETRKKFYNDFINQTKDYVIGFMPITTPLYACDYKLLFDVTKEWYKML